MVVDPLYDRVAAAKELLHRVAEEHAPAVLASSFGAEDMVLIDLIARDRLDIGIFTPTPGACRRRRRH
jgi:phosphoadenosine phosphosulfate reductase